MCDQQRLRPACAYAQSDQSLCWSLEYSFSVKLLTEQHFEFQSIIGGCTGWYESTLVKMSHCWKSRVAAHIMIEDLDIYILDFQECWVLTEIRISFKLVLGGVRIVPLSRSSHEYTQ